MKTLLWEEGLPVGGAVSDPVAEDDCEAVEVGEFVLQVTAAQPVVSQIHILADVKGAGGTWGLQ